MTDYETIEEMLEQKAINGEHLHVRRYPDERHSVCICGEVFWTGERWAGMPDPFLYMDTLDGAAEARHKGIDRDDHE